MLNSNTKKTEQNKLIRARIVPFGGMPAAQQNQCFTVGWHPQPLTFQQIMEAIRDKIVKELVYFRKVARQHLPDLLQQGWLRLWQVLQENPHFLAEHSRLAAADYVSNRCGTSTLHSYLQRYASYHEISRWDEPDSINFEDNITDIVIGSSLKSTGRGRHALFARKVDIHLDIACAIRDVAAWCGDNIKKLAALYFITTSVSQADAGRIAGLRINKPKGRKPRCVALQYWARQVLERLQTVLASYRPVEPNRHDWRDCLKGGQVEPVIALAKEYSDEPRKLLALYSLTTQVSTETIIQQLGVDACALKYAQECVRHDLRYRYARRVPTKK